MTYNVLVVDDSPDWRAHLAHYLIVEGEYNVFEAGDYEAATKLIQNQPLDVALVDIRLVDWDAESELGMELLCQLDEISEVNGTRSIVITGYGTLERVRRCFRDHQHCVDFMSKQKFEPAEFRRTVLEAAKEARKARGEIIDRKYS